MPRGGRRPGAGRKPKSTNKRKSYAVIKAAFESGEPVPLEIMIECMRHYWREWEAHGNPDDMKQAGVWAQASAPYCHPRLQALDARTTMEAGDTLTKLLKEIDGKTLGLDGIKLGGSPLALGAPVYLSGQDGQTDLISSELDAERSPEQSAPLQHCIEGEAIGQLDIDPTVDAGHVSVQQQRESGDDRAQAG